MKDPSSWVKKAKGWSLRKHKRERMKNGFSKADWINFDTYIAWVICNAVKKMRDEGHTCFSYLDEPSENWEALTNAEYEVMIRGFGRYAKFEDNDFIGLNYAEESRATKQELDEALEIFKNRFTSLWD